MISELLRSNDFVFLSWVGVLLSDAGIEYIVFDVHTSLVEGSIGAIPRRLMVHQQDFYQAQHILSQASISSI